VNNEKGLSYLGFLTIFLFIFLAFLPLLDMIAESVSEKQQPVKKTIEFVEPTNFGSNVYLFTVKDGYFGKVLAKFKKEHPNLRVTAITIAKQHTDSTIPSYWVNFEER